jgi:MFS family permease
MFLNGGIIQMYSIICQIITECYDKSIRGIVFGIYMASIGTIDLMFVILYKYLHSIYPAFWFNIISQAVCLLSYAILYIESPVWLISQNKSEECIQILEKAARFNSKLEELKSFKTDLEKYIKEKSEIEDKDKKTNYTMLDCFKYPSIRKLVLLLSPMWIVIVCFDFVIFMFVDKVSDDIYIGGITTCIAVLSSAFISGFVVDWIGRKTSIILFSIMSFVSFALNPLMKAYEWKWPEVILIFASGFGIESAFTCVILISSEVFPTTIKGVSNGTVYLIGRIGAIASPFVLDKLPYPQYIISGITALVTILMFFLNETKGYHVSEDIEEVSEGKVLKTGSKIVPDNSFSDDNNESASVPLKD